MGPEMLPITVRAMREEDLDVADRVFRRAFGTMFGLPEPERFRGDSALLRPRFAADPEAAFVAEEEGRIVGSIMAADWGSVGTLGPVSVAPEAWGRGIARLLVPPVLDLFARRGVTLGALFTHPQSAKHVRLYEAFGFELGAVTAILAKESGGYRSGDGAAVLLSSLDPVARAAVMHDCRALAGSLYDGLDLGREIATVVERRLGDCVLLRGTGEGSVAGFAVCHYGAGSEAGSKALLVKFAAVRPGAAADFAALLAHCEGLAAALGAARLTAAVNTARRQAYRLMRAAGYRSLMNGVAMHRPDRAGYDRPEIFAIDDLR